MGNADNVLFDNDSRVAPLGLIAMAGASELGKKVDGYLTKWANENEFVKDTFLVEVIVFNFGRISEYFITKVSNNLFRCCVCEL